MPHLMKSHEDEDDEITLPDINEPATVDRSYVISHFGQHFFVTHNLETSGDRYLFATVQLIGSRKQAKNVDCRLEINDQGRRVTWEATTTRSIMTVLYLMDKTFQIRAS